MQITNNLFKKRMAAENIKELVDILHEGLNLCVRARKIDEGLIAEKCREMGSYAPEHVNCGTPHLWVREQYDKDLAEWEKTARTALKQYT
jgi:hypothetical protein